MSGGVHCGGVLLSTVAKEKEVSGGNFQDFFFSGADIMPLYLLLASPRFSLMSLKKCDIFNGLPTTRPSEDNDLIIFKSLP